MPITTGLVNHFYFYCVDADFGPFFLKFCTYFPYNAKLCINGNHWARRQAAKAGIAFTTLDNAFASVEDPAGLQAICDRLGEVQIDALLRKWLALLPHPFTPADRAAGYRSPRPAPLRSVDGGPSPTTAQAARSTGRTETVPVFTAVRSTKESPAMPLRHRHAYPAARQRGLRAAEPRTAPEFPPTNWSMVRTAPDPHPPGSGSVTSEEA